MSKVHRSIGLAISLMAIALSANAARWGSDYFPNVALTTHEGEKVRFFEDLIENKTVAINFIYTTCADTCPLETAQLAKVQRILGDRLGRDIHIYSITIDPAHDTVEVLKDYRGKFGAKWTFLTGAEEDIVLLRQKLGLYIDDIQDGSLNHNVSMIIGNQTTGRWMKRSPFENPYVLADQLTNWLSGWKDEQVKNDYADAPVLRDISDGEKLFRTRCSICHSIAGQDDPELVGPDLMGVTSRRDPTWLRRWLRAPDKMLAEGDPLATALYERYQKVSMPNMRLSTVDIEALVEYLGAETERVVASRQPSRAVRGGNDAVVAVANAFIREPIEGASADAGYFTLVNIGDTEEILIEVSSPAFRKVEVHEMVKGENGLPRMRRVPNLALAPGLPVKLAPGGKHLMLMGAHRSLRPAQTVDVTLKFESGREQVVAIKVDG